MLIVGLSLTLLATLISADTYMIPASCTCDNRRMQCNRTFSTFIPSYINVVDLSELDLTNMLMVFSVKLHGIIYDILVWFMQKNIIEQH